MRGLLTCEAFSFDYKLLNDRVNTLGYNMSAIQPYCTSHHCILYIEAIPSLCTSHQVLTVSNSLHTQVLGNLITIIIPQSG